MSPWEVVMLIVMLAVMAALAIQNWREKPRASRFRQALWAESVRKRGLSVEEAEREAYILGYIDTPPDALTLTPELTRPQVEPGDRVKLIVGEKTWIGIYPDGPWQEQS